MNSLKGWGDSPHQIDASHNEGRHWLRLSVGLGIAVAGLLAVVAATVIVPMLWADPALHAEKARGQLRQAVEEIETGGFLQALAAEKHAADYIDAGGSPATGYLLASAALSIRSHSESFTMEDRQNLNSTTSRVQIGQVETSDLLLVADVYFNAGAALKADWLLRQLLVRPLDPQQKLKALRLAVQVRFDTGADDDALRLAKELAELAPEDCLPWVAMSRLAEDQDVPEAMVDAYRGLLQRDCNDASDTRLKLAEQLIVVGDHAAARKQYDWLTANSPDTLSQSPALRAKLLVQEGNAEAASAAIKEILAADQHNADALILSSRLALGRNEPDIAIKNLQTVVKAEPANTEAMYLLGQAFARAGKTTEAKQQLKKQDEVRNAKVELHRLERQAGANPRDAELRHEIARKYYEIGYLEKAKYWRQQALSLER